MDARGAGRARRDFTRLRDVVVETLGPAIALAFLSLAAVVGLKMLLGPVPGAQWVPYAALVYFHAVFIATIAWKALHRERPLLRCVVRPGLAGGAALTLPILMFALLDLLGASYVCADGAVVWTSPVPNLPWLWIGWSVLTVIALPALCVGLAVGEMPPLIPVRRRLALAAAFVPLVLVTGLVFEWRAPDCTPPFDGWGFMEGGMVLVPLVGLFWFVLSFSMAALSAAFVDQDRLG